MNADGLFRGKDEAIISDLTRVEFMVVLASMDRPSNPTVFVGTYNLE
jgi:hypothetical protein